MKKHTTLLEELNNNNIFVDNKFTYYEFVDQIKKFNEIIAQKAFKEEYHPSFGIEDVMLELKKKVIKYDLLNSYEYKYGIKALKDLDKQLRISMAGKKAEDRVNNLLDKYVTRDDYMKLSNVYLYNGYEDSEIDNVILTKNGFILLEVKNIKDDVRISEEGRLFIGKDCSYEQYTFSAKMDRKRNLFKQQIKKALKEKGFHINITLDTYVVFNDPWNNCRISNYSEEKWCKSNKIAYIVNDHYNPFPYSDSEFEILKECLYTFSTNKKYFNIDLDIELAKQDVCALFDLIEKHIPVISKEDKEHKPNLFEVLQSFLKPTVAATTIVATIFTIISNK